jgi:hypothetical protein
MQDVRQIEIFGTVGLFTNSATETLATSTPVCTENLIRVEAAMESPKLAE